MLLRPLGQLSIIKKYSGRRTRTVDTLINSQMLYQLSYAGIIAWQRPTLAGGDPPTTLGVKKLDFCVRHGNRYILLTIVTTLCANLRYHLRKLLSSQN